MRQFENGYIKYVYDEEKLEKEVLDDPRCYDNSDVINKLKQEYAEREFNEFLETIKEKMKALGLQQVNLEEVLKRFGLLNKKEFYVWVYEKNYCLSMMFEDHEFLDIWKTPEGITRVDYTYYVEPSEEPSKEETKEQKQAIKA